jgi:hypothetical protein
VGVELGAFHEPRVADDVGHEDCPGASLEIERYACNRFSRGAANNERSPVSEIDPRSRASGSCFTASQLSSRIRAKRGSHEGSRHQGRSGSSIPRRAASTRVAYPTKMVLAPALDYGLRRVSNAKQG